MGRRYRVAWTLIGEKRNFGKVSKIDEFIKYKNNKFEFTIKQLCSQKNFLILSKK